MSLSSLPRPARRGVWIMQLWPLALFLLLLLLGGQFVIRYWPELLLQSAVWQKGLNQQLSQLLIQVKAEPMRAGLGLMLFSLLYGILHAAGPGHGKVIITAYLATHPSRLKSSLRLTFAAALMQGMVAVALVTLVLVVLQLSSRQLHQGSFWLEKGSFVIMILLGFWLCLRALKRLWTIVRGLRALPLTIHRLRPLTTHVHDEHCGCGHRHLPSEAELQASGDWRTRLAVVVAMGLRPCSGAILVLLFSKVIGVYLWGVASALLMALGTSVTISLLALLVHGARRLAVRLGSRETPPVWRSVAWASLALAGGMIVLSAGVLFYVSAQPAMMGGLRPFL